MKRPLRQASVGEFFNEIDAKLTRISVLRHHESGRQASDFIQLVRVSRQKLIEQPPHLRRCLLRRRKRRHQAADSRSRARFSPCVRVRIVEQLLCEYIRPIQVSIYSSPPLKSMHQSLAGPAETDHDEEQRRRRFAPKAVRCSQVRGPSPCRISLITTIGVIRLGFRAPQWRQRRATTASPLRRVGAQLYVSTPSPRSPASPPGRPSEAGGARVEGIMKRADGAPRS